MIQTIEDRCLCACKDSDGSGGPPRKHKTPKGGSDLSVFVNM